MTITKQQYIDLYRVMRRCRTFEDAAADLWHDAEIHGELHLSNGHEAVAAGVCAHLGDDDAVAGTHRAHGAAIAKGVELEPMLAEILGREGGLSRGKGGHMHLFDAERNFGTSGIVGAGLPLSLGPAAAADMRGTDDVSVAFLGTGATNQGAFHESLNLAAVWELPVVFVVEDDRWAVSMSKEETTGVASNVERARGNGLEGIHVDGMNPRETYAAAGYAVERARNGGGPTLLEAECYHFRGHFETFPREAVAPEELEAWRERDPIPRARRELEEEYGVPPADLDEIDESVEAEVGAAVEAALDSPLPDPSVALENVFTDAGTEHVTGSGVAE